MTFPFNLITGFPQTRPAGKSENLVHSFNPLTVSRLFFEGQLQGEEPRHEVGLIATVEAVENIEGFGGLLHMDVVVDVELHTGRRVIDLNR